MDALLRLFQQHFGDARVRMAESVHADTRDGIQIPVAFRIENIAAPAGGQDERITIVDLQEELSLLLRDRFNAWKSLSGRHSWSLRCGLLTYPIFRLLPIHRLGISLSTQSITKPDARAGNLLDVGVTMPTAELQVEKRVEKNTPLPVSTRLPQLDTLRGFLLVWMTLTHLPTHVSSYSNQMVGYVSAAEGFILLAAILVGRIQQGASQKHGESAANEKLRHRVLRIYGYHLGLLAFAFSVCALAAVYLHRVPLQNLLDFYLQHPKEALISAPVLLYNPPLLDILPMYIVFMLLTPFLMRVAERWGWGYILLGSGSIWLLAQFHLREWVYMAGAHFGFPIPLNEMGAFDWFGWQFLWTIGLCLGSARAVSLFSKARVPRWLIPLSATIAIILFTCRHTAFDVLAGPTLFDALVNKWRLGIFRLIDAAAIGVLLVKFGSPLADTWLGQRLATLGRASLEVFSAHLVFCFIFLGIGAGPDVSLAWWQDAMIVTVTVASLFIVASYIDKRRSLDNVNLRERAVYQHAGDIR